MDDRTLHSHDTANDTGMGSTTNPSSPAVNDPIRVVCGCDESYAMPLAVTLSSMLRNANPARPLEITIMDGGIQPESIERLHRLTKRPDVSIRIVKIGTSLLRDCPVSEHVNICSYFRLLIPSIYPNDVERVLYLDSDLLVQKDIATLWDQPLGDASVLAGPDAAGPVIDADVVWPGDVELKQYLGSHCPIVNYRELGICPTASYFNAGVLLINLDRWRREDIGTQALQNLKRYHQHVLWWDQYALNVTLHQSWRPFDPRWNQGSYLYHYPSAIHSPFDPNVYQDLRDDPWIAHFTSGEKPWHYNCRHPLKDRYLDAIQHTPWSGFRPAKPVRPSGWKAWCDRNGAKWSRSLRKRFSKPCQPADQHDQSTDSRRRAA